MLVEEGLDFASRSMYQDVIRRCQGKGVYVQKLQSKCDSNLKPAISVLNVIACKWYNYTVFLHIFGKIGVCVCVCEW